MQTQIKNDTWVWIFIQNPGQNEEIVGQQDAEKNVAFVPAYLSKEEALQSLHLLVRKPGAKYEAQAILYEDLAKHASDNGFAIFFLDAEGRLLEVGVE